jgi:hypothetical protein
MIPSSAPRRVRRPAVELHRSTGRRPDVLHAEQRRRQREGGHGGRGGLSPRRGPGARARPRRALESRSLREGDRRLPTSTTPAARGWGRHADGRAHGFATSARMRPPPPMAIAPPSRFPRRLSTRQTRATNDAAGRETEASRTIARRENPHIMRNQASASSGRSAERPARRAAGEAGGIHSRGAGSRGSGHASEADPGPGAAPIAARAPPRGTGRERRRTTGSRPPGSERRGRRQVVELAQ